MTGWVLQGDRSFRSDLNVWLPVRLSAPELFRGKSHTVSTCRS